MTGLESRLQVNQLVRADRMPQASQSVLCGACGGVIADAREGFLSFPQDAEDEWRGWFCSGPWEAHLPGGVWEVAPKDGPRQQPLTSQLEMLPAVIECPACEAGNLFDPEHLVLRPNQLVARAHGLVISSRRSSV